MNKWYQTIIVNHIEEDGQTTHWLDDENYKILCEERAEQLKEIEKLKSIIKEVREKVKGVKKINNEVYKQTDMLERFYSRKWCNDEMDSFLDILDKKNNNE